jgi:hypothetical protein
MVLKDIVEVQARGAHLLWVRFEGGEDGEVDLAKVLRFTGVLADLADPDYFAQARVDPELGTVVWPNGADLDPLVLYCLVTGKPLPRFHDPQAASNF